MTRHLISLADLHVTAPGVLDVVFGPDGDFEGAPEWRCPIWDSEDGPDGGWMGISRYAQHPIAEQFDPLDTMFFDLRLPSVATRLAGLCARATQDQGSLYDSGTIHTALLSPWHGMTDEDAARLRALVRRLAPGMAALKVTS